MLTGFSAKIVLALYDKYYLRQRNDMISCITLGIPMGDFYHTMKQLTGQGFVKMSAVSFLDYAETADILQDISDPLTSTGIEEAKKLTHAR